MRRGGSAGTFWAHHELRLGTERRAIYQIGIGMKADALKGRHVYEADYPLGARVLIGEDDQTVGKVTAICWRTEFPQIEVSWMHNGTLQCVWVPPTLLRPAPTDR